VGWKRTTYSAKVKQKWSKSGAKVGGGSENSCAPVSSVSSVFLGMFLVSILVFCNAAISARQLVNASLMLVNAS